MIMTCWLGGISIAGGLAALTGPLPPIQLPPTACHAVLSHGCHTRFDMKHMQPKRMQAKRKQASTLHSICAAGVVLHMLQ